MTLSAESEASSGAGRRDKFLSTMAILFGVLAISDFTKALQRINDPAHAGLVILGHKLQSLGANAVGGSILGAILATYAYGLWTKRRWTLPLGATYAFYVPVNEVLFWFLNTGPRPSVGFIVFYLAVSLTGSVGTAIYLALHRDQLS